MREGRSRRLEPRNLEAVQRVVENFRRDEVAHQEIGAARRAVSGHRLVKRIERVEPEPAHPRVEMQR